MRPSSWSRWRRARTVSSRSGSSSTRSTSWRSSCSMSASSACTPRSRAASSANGARPSSAATASPSASSAASFERLVRARERVAVGDRVGEHASSASSATSSSGSSSAGGGDLLDLEAQQVDLPGPGAGVAAERGELGVERADRRSLVAVARPSASSAAAPAKRSSAPRCTAGSSSDWCACWPCRSTSARPTSASSPAVARRPST